MLFPKVDPKHWAKLYGIPLKPEKCLKCSSYQVFTTPFAHGPFRGLISDHGECGEEFRRSVFTLSSENDRKDLARLFDRIKAP